MRNIGLLQTCLSLFGWLVFFPASVTAQLLTVSTVTSPPACHGYTNGAIEAMPDGGQPPYTYQWSNGQSGKTIFGIGAGDYSVTVTDVAGTAAVAMASVDDPEILAAGIDPEADICEGNLGIFNATATGGTPPYNFAWSNGETGPALANPDPGYFFLTVTDANNCQVVQGIAISAPLQASVNTIDAVCPLACDGSAEAVISGGTGPYTFLWNTGAATQVVFPLPAGTFTVTLTDSNGCTSVASGDVGEPPPFVLDFLVQNECSGSADASISATGGTPPFTYEWSNGVLGEQVSGLQQGVWFVTVTDANGCKTDTSVTVSAGAAVIVADAVDAACNGVDNGAATATVTSGIGPLSYLWSDGQTTQTATSLAPGTYFVTLTDGAGCTDVATAGIGALSFIELETSSTGAGCGVSSLGTATVAVTFGGNGPFNFLWSNGQMSQTATGLTAGAYEVTVTDIQGCEATATATVAPSVGLSILVQADPANCHNTADGGAQIAQVSSNAVLPLGYEWSNGTAADFIENVLPGAYSVTVTDAQGCTGAVPVNISSNASISADFTWETDGCPGDTVQVQFAQAVDFSPPANPIAGWAWSFSDGQAATLPDPLMTFTDSIIEAVLVVENSTGCKDTVSQTIEIQNTLEVEFQNGLGCITDTFELSAIFDPSANFTFQWVAGSPSVAVLGNGTGPSVSVVASDTGTFVVYVTAADVSGCVLQDSVELTVTSEDFPFDPALLTYTQCEGLEIHFTNHNSIAGAFQWFFNWPSDPAATSTLPNPSYLYPDTGSYTVALVPMLNCVADTFFLHVSVAPPPFADFFIETSECSDTVTVVFTDASVTPGNITAWNWTFSNGETFDLQNPTLVLGTSQTLTATLVVEFETGCTATVFDSVAVEVFDPPFPAEDTVIACLPVPTAALNPGGDPSLSYQWFPPAGLDDPTGWNPTATVANTTPYMVTITDNSGPEPCSVVKKVTVLVPDAIGLTPPADIEACEAGMLTISAGAAVSPAFFQWSSQPDFSDTLGLEPTFDVNVTSPPSMYFVQVTDQYGCAQASQTTAGYYPVTAQVPDFEIVCAGEIPAITIPGVAAGDVVVWSPFNPNGQIPKDTSDFTVTITNVYGCVQSDTLTINVVDVNQFIEVLPALDTILQGESVTLSVISGLDHFCAWSPDASLDDAFNCEPVASPLMETTYTVEVEDAATGCRGSGSATICVVNSICGEPMIFVPNAFTPNGDGLNDVLFVRGYNIERVVVFAIYNRWGEKVFESRSLEEGWDGRFNGRLATGDVFAYYLKVECRSGEEFFKKGNVTLVR